MDSLLSASSGASNKKKKAAVPPTPRTPGRARAMQTDDDNDESDEPPSNPTTPAANRVRSRSEPKYPFTPLRTPKRAAAATAEDDAAKEFRYDRVFGPEATQEAMFDEVESQVASVVDGFNTTVFVYGQTGAGKTFTMMGDDTASTSSSSSSTTSSKSKAAASPDRGIAQRAIERVFAAIDERPNSLFVVRVSYVELYNDNFRDLLDPDNQPSAAPVVAAVPLDATPHKEASKKHAIIIRETTGGDVYLEGSDTLNTRVKSASDAFRLIRAGTKARHVAQTALNGASSRSHAILTIVVESSSSGGRVVQRGTLNLVDLAGSERLKKSMAEGATARETAKINQSLSVLGDVLSALSSENYSGRVPYRNSKLTRLLSSTLGGNSQTFFIIHLHTTALHYHESLMSCMYGARAKRIKNMVEANNDTSSSGDMRRLQAEIDTLKASLHTNNVELMRLRETKTHSDKQSADVHEKLALMVEITSQEKQRLEAKMEEIIHMANATKAEAKYERQALEAECAGLRDMQNRLKLQLVKTEDERDQFRDSLASLEADVAKLHDERDDARSALAAAQARVAKLEQQLLNAKAVAAAAAARPKAAVAKKSDIERQVAQFMATYKADEASSADDEQLAVQPPSPPLHKQAQRGTKRKPVAEKPKAVEPEPAANADDDEDDEASDVKHTESGDESDEVPVAKPKRAIAKKTHQQQPTKRARASEVAPPAPVVVTVDESPVAAPPVVVDKENAGTPVRAKHNGVPLAAVNKAPRLAPTKFGASKLAVPTIKQAPVVSKTPVESRNSSTHATPVKAKQPTPLKSATPKQPTPVKPDEKQEEQQAISEDEQDEQEEAPPAKSVATPKKAVVAKKSGGAQKRKMFNPTAFMISPAVAPVQKKKSSGLALAGAPSLRDFLMPAKVKQATTTTN
jgi:predicted  nucleic acid-binding Zn-ribbon protein